MTSRAAEAAPFYSYEHRPAVLRGQQVDFWLLGAVLGLLGLGVVMVFDASYFLGAVRFGDAYALIVRQAIFICMSATLAATLARVDPLLLKRLAYPALFAVLALLVLVLIPGIGQVRGGARRWISLGLFAFEPSELMKPVFVLYLARSLSAKQDRMHSFSFGILPHIVMMLVPILLLLLEPDFGASAVITMVTLAMLFAAGARLKHLAMLGLAVLPPAVALVWHSPYRLERVTAFLDPWRDPLGNGFQLVQSFLAFGSGGVLGAGLGNGKQKLFYLPEGHTDFIFALIGEELGLIGCVAVLVCFGVLAMRGFRVATRSRDRFTGLLAFGLTFLFVGQALLNIGVALGMLPTKGMPLPLVSYGGSAMMAAGLSVGVLLALSREVRP
ncbi:MAG: putative lipid II flippase FtsW [Deltaproteobacteria bacterium]|nr:putative lipid II flippase FtsW [Deltaproteobacteria bacterium]